MPCHTTRLVIAVVGHTGPRLSRHRRCRATVEPWQRWRGIDHLRSPHIFHQVRRRGLPSPPLLRLSRARSKMDQSLVVVYSSSCDGARAQGAAESFICDFRAQREALTQPNRLIFAFCLFASALQPLAALSRRPRRAVSAARYAVAARSKQPTASADTAQFTT